MSKEKRRVPKLRFPGFTEDWEQRKFGDLFEYERPDAYIVKSDNYNNDFNMPVLTANKAFILGYTNEENSYNKPSIIFDDFTLDRKYVDFPYMLKSSAIKILTSKNQHNLRFLFERLNSTRFEVLGHARHYISVVQNTTTLCPSVDEEVCISNLLTKFDELITLHQRKLDNLKLKKKALLQKLFPKNGERYPELRFPGFIDAWEQRKLGTILSRRKENRLIDSEYPRLAFAAGQGVIPLSERRTNNRDQLISDEKNKKYLVTYYNDIVYNPANVKYGAIDRNKYGQGVISPIYVTFTSNVCSGFIEHIVKSNDFKQKALSFEEGTVTKRQAVNPDNLLNIDVDITLNIEEQKKISNLFELLGQYITLHQRKLDHLQLQKKALLQQMFV